MTHKPDEQDWLRKTIVKHTSEMLDNPDENEIYPTTKFYNNLEADILAHYAPKPIVTPDTSDGEVDTIGWRIVQKHTPFFKPTDLANAIDTAIHQQRAEAEDMAIIRSIQPRPKGMTMKRWCQMVKTVIGIEPVKTANIELEQSITKDKGVE